MEIEERLLTEIERFQKVGKLLRGFMACAFLLGGWVATLEMRQQAASKQVAKIEPMEKWIAVRTGNQWTIQQHSEYARSKDAADRKVLDELNKRNELQELRLQRLEDEQGRISRTIEERLKVTPSDVLNELRRLSREHALPE